MVRWPLNTRLLNGQEMNSRLGSIITTSMDGSAIRTYLAAVAPPQPPPITTTRRPLLGAMSPVMRTGAARESKPGAQAQPDTRTRGAEEISARQPAHDPASFIDWLVSRPECGEIY